MKSEGDWRKRRMRKFEQSMLFSPSPFFAGDSLVTLSDLDPLGLHLPHHSRHRGMARHLGFKAPGHDTVIQVALISETSRY